jgi:hypothetical protein
VSDLTPAEKRETRHEERSSGSIIRSLLAEHSGAAHLVPESATFFNSAGYLFLGLQFQPSLLNIEDHRMSSFARAGSR